MGVTSRRMAPPLPEASQPSNTTHTGGPSRPSPSSPPRVSLSASRRLEAVSSRAASSVRLSLRLRSSSLRRPIRRSWQEPPAPGKRASSPAPQRRQGETRGDRLRIDLQGDHGGAARPKGTVEGGRDVGGGDDRLAGGAVGLGQGGEVGVVEAGGDHPARVGPL